MMNFYFILVLKPLLQRLKIRGFKFRELLPSILPEESTLPISYLPKAVILNNMPTGSGHIPDRGTSRDIGYSDQRLLLPLHCILSFP